MGICQTYRASINQKFENDEIKAISDVALRVPDYPNHTQSVERCVKIVTDTSKAVYGQEARDGYIRAILVSRSKMPRFDTKRHFVSNKLK